MPTLSESSSKQLLAGYGVPVLDERVAGDPAAAVAAAGALGEALGDVAFRVVPLTDLDADELIDDLATQKLLGPFRGEPAVDRAALRSTLLGLSRFAVERPDVAAVDLNPLIVVGGRPIA